ncbi:MAG: SMC-Scp complex subunit ScpB, partial [Deltaproteobacteria bacterium]
MTLRSSVVLSTMLLFHACDPATGTDTDTDVDTDTDTDVDTDT